MVLSFSHPCLSVRFLELIQSRGNVFADRCTPINTTTLTTAIIERLVNLVERIQLADKYTDEIGAQLGILTTKPEQIAPEDWKPEIKARALPGGKIENMFVRGESDGILYETQIGAETVWTEKARFFKSPGTITVSGNQPQTVRLRARYLIKRRAVGRFRHQVVLRLASWSNPSVYYGIT